jgi:hypothetical protein
VLRLCRLLCRPQADAEWIARELGAIAGERGQGSVIAVTPSNRIWKEIEVHRASEGQVDQVELTPAGWLKVPLVTLEGVLGPGGESLRLHWEDPSVWEFWVEQDGYACSVFVDLPHPVRAPEGKATIERVTVRRNGRVEDP